MSPRSFFPHGSAVSPTGSSSGHVIALDQSGARKSAIRAHSTTDENLTFTLADHFLLRTTPNTRKEDYGVNTLFILSYKLPVFLRKAFQIATNFVLYSLFTMMSIKKIRASIRRKFIFTSGFRRV